MIKPSPDFSRLRKALLRQGEPDRVPFYELFVDGEIIEAVIKKPLTKLDINKSEEKKQYVKWLVEFYYNTGYDYVPLPIGTVFPCTNTLQAEDTASLPRSVRSWQDEHRGTIETREDFEKYKWTDIKSIDFSIFELMSKNLPDGMKMIPLGPGGVLENVMWLMGYEPMSYAIYEDPRLIQEMFDRVGWTLEKVFDTFTRMDNVGALALGDVMGFKTQTMISPEMLRKYVFPWQKKIVEVAHRKNLPLILHSCGNLESVMDDLIDYVGIDAKHSYENVIMPITEAKKKYGNRIAVLGGIDVDILSRLSEKEVRKEVTRILYECAPGGGYALGSGNTIANYVKLENYLAMLDEGSKYEFQVKS